MLVGKWQRFYLWKIPLFKKESERNIKNGAVYPFKNKKNINLKPGKTQRRKQKEWNTLLSKGNIKISPQKKVFGRKISRNEFYYWAQRVRLHLKLDLEKLYEIVFANKRILQQKRFTRKNYGKKQKSPRSQHQKIFGWIKLRECRW